MFLLFVLLHKLTPHFIHKFFGKAQILSAAWMAHSHGTNDAQKTMGVIAVLLYAHGALGREEWLEGRRAELQARMRQRRGSYAP